MLSLQVYRLNNIILIGDWMNNKKDLRIIKTQKCLYDALVNLMKDRPFEEIKVSDICNEAMINRSTFYAHYNDKYELLADYIKDLKELLTKELDKNKNISNTKEYYLEMIRLLLNHIEDRKNTYIEVMINNKNSITMDIFYDVINTDITKRIKNDGANKGKIPSEIIAKFYIGAVFNVSTEWLKKDRKYTREDLLMYLDRLIPNELDF